MTAENKFSATGRRKEAVARVSMVPGKGIFTINGRPYEDYLMRETLVNHAKAPLVLMELEGKYDIILESKEDPKHSKTPYCDFTPAGNSQPLEVEWNDDKYWCANSNCGKGEFD